MVRSKYSRGERGKKIYDKHERKNLLAYFSFACIKEREGGNGSRADDFVVK